MSAKELNIGDYVRTKKGTIYKFNSKSNMAKNGAKKYMVKSSPNIIDLIEYDDILKIVYENKEYICKVVSVSGVKGIQLTSTLSVGLGIVEAGIKSIVTKEQFESMEYKVE